MKILWKIFRSNFWNCAICFMSCILLSTILFLFDGIKEMLTGSMTEQEIRNSAVGISVNIYSLVLLFIGIILILYTIKQYSRSRIRDYGLFMVLGSERSGIIRMILIEYGFICLLSYIVGCLTGMLILLMIKKIIISEGISVIWSCGMLAGSALKTSAYIFLAFLIAVVLNLIYLYTNSLDSLLKYKEKKTKVPNVILGIIGFLSGIFFLVLSAVLLLGEPPEYRRMRNGVILGLTGLYLCFTFGGALGLVFLSRRQKWYFRHLFRIKNLYYRFSENKNIILLIFVINFFVFVFVNLNIVEYSATSSKYLWKYPYDLVWMTEKEHTDDIIRITNQLNPETTFCPYKIVSSGEGGRYLAISEEFFRKFTGVREKLKAGEILAVMQKADTDEETMFRGDQVYLQDGEKGKRFVIKKEIKEILFVAQQSENIFVIVMKEEDYRSMSNTKEERLIVTQKLGKKNKEVEEGLRLQAQNLGVRLFSKDELMLQDRKEDIMTLIFYICMGIFLVISNLTVLAVKAWAEIPLLCRKYCFLGMIGMDSEDIKNNIKSELSLCMNIPFLLSGAVGILFLLYMARAVEKKLFLEVILLFSVLIILQFIYIMAVRSYGYRLTAERMERWNGGGIWN